MSDKKKKLFGVWMDSHNATIVGKADDSEDFVIVGHVKTSGADNNSNENASNNQEITLTQKFFRDIAGQMPNMDGIHITGTGQIQEQFKRFLAESPQHKNAVATDSTSNKMSDKNLTEYIANHFN